MAIYFIIAISLGLFLSLIYGKKRRIGIAWTFFFTFTYILPGVIFLYTSPKLTKVPKPIRAERTLNNAVGVLAGAIAILSLVNLIDDISQDGAYMDIGIYFTDGLGLAFVAGLSVFLLTSNQRNQKAYEEWSKMQVENLTFEGDKS